MPGAFLTGEMMAGPILELRGIAKRYPGVLALSDFSFELREGEVHALVGENGAGKSTLIKVISGAISPDSGEILVGGTRFAAMTPSLSRSSGIEVIYQEFNLVGSMSAAENIFLGDRSGAFVDFREMRRKAAVFESFDVDIDPDALVRDLSPAKQQIVEITKAISRNIRVLLMDEPTAPLTASEVDHLFAIVGKLKSAGISIVYISHRLDEVFALADRVTVMRDGRFVSTVATAETNRAELIRMMVGRQLSESYPPRVREPGGVALEVRRLRNARCDGESFKLLEGEILGVAGLVGAGRTEMARTIYGADPRDSGEIEVYGKIARARSPFEAIKEGIGLIPEDRKTQGCFLDMAIGWNITIMSIRKLARGPFVDGKAVGARGGEFFSLLRIKAPGIETKVNALSGGNQQKVVLAKVLAADTKILIFDEPTRGIDVGAKQEIYALMRELAEKGHSILMISSDMEELLGLSDRIIVVAEGRISGELERSEFFQTRILELASASKLQGESRR